MYKGTEPLLSNMVELTFGESATGLMIETLGYGYNEDNLVLDKNGDVATDAFEHTIEVDEVGGVIHLEDPYGLSNGRVTFEGEFVSNDYGEERPESLVPIDDETAFLREGFSHIVNYAECEKRKEEM